jgi:hypothetical protein
MATTGGLETGSAFKRRARRSAIHRAPSGRAQGPADPEDGGAEHPKAYWLFPRPLKPTAWDTELRLPAWSVAWAFTS